MLTRRTLMGCAAAVAACQNPQRPHGSDPSWRRISDAPYAVQEIYPVLHDGGVWIAGGFAPRSLGATERVIVCDATSGVWRAGPPLPTPSHHVQLASLGGELLAIGGFLGGDTRMRWICTPRVLRLQFDRWIPGPLLPKPIGEAVAVAHDGRIHLIGGRSPRGQANASWEDHADVGDHFVLAAGAPRWERAAPLPLPRNSAAGAGFGGEIHVVSGRTVGSGETAAHHIYDPRADAWREGPLYPDPRGGLAAAVWRGRLIAGGGEGPDSVSDALYAFDGAAWTRFATMPTPRHGFGMIATEDALYCLCGARRPSGSETQASVDVLG